MAKMIDYGKWDFREEFSLKEAARFFVVEFTYQ